VERGREERERLLGLFKSGNLSQADFSREHGIIGVSETGPGNIAPNPHRVSEGSCPVQAGFDVSKTLPKRQLREDHAKQMIASTETAACLWHRKSGYTALEVAAINAVGNLGKNESPLVHSPGESASAPRKRVQMRNKPLRALSRRPSGSQRNRIALNWTVVMTDI
jgi:hypothetical protein